MDLETADGAAVENPDSMTLYTWSQESPQSQQNHQQMRMIPLEHTKCAQLFFRVVAAKGALLLWKTSVRQRFLIRWNQFQLAKQAIEVYGVQGNLA